MTKSRDMRKLCRNEIRDHRLIILRDDGDYRHFCMSPPDNYFLKFYLLTAPGFLAYYGDLGSYNFQFPHQFDVLPFFRRDIHKGPEISYSYWAEKLCAVNKRGDFEELDEDHFKEAALREFWNHNWPDKETRRHEWKFHIRDLIAEKYQSSSEAIAVLMEYHYTSWARAVHPFDDLFEHGPFKKPSVRFRWACWAIAETISKYDQNKEEIA